MLSRWLPRSERPWPPSSMGSSPESLADLPVSVLPALDFATPMVGTSGERRGT
jgi:hypothetical protein